MGKCPVGKVRDALNLSRGEVGSYIIRFDENQMDFSHHNLVCIRSQNLWCFLEGFEP